MKLVFRQYLASLRERGELDAVLPDLLSELGYTVISRPTIGTRQYGVDVAAIGKVENGKRKLLLFSIKQGDLTRADWTGTPQALRSSLEEILEIYIPTRIAKEHQKLKIVVCLCFGGDIQEAVRDSVTGFINRHTTDHISFAEWNGDYMAGLLVEGVLREQLLDKALRTSFQKAVAMVDEPEIAFEHFSVLVRKLCAATATTPKQRTTIIRQIYICLWVLFIWARDAGNVEGPYRASEFALLNAWHLIREDVAKSTKASVEIGLAFYELGELHSLILDELLGKKILPFVEKRHAISIAVRSASSVDVNIKLFDLLGRTAMRGLWALWSKSGADSLPRARSDWDEAPASELAQRIVLLIRNNPLLLSPISDAQSIEVGLAIVFLTMMEEWQPAARNLIEELINRVTFAYRTHNRYPTIHSAYRDLIVHPRERTDGYREAETAGSTLFPLLSIWASSLGCSDAARHLAEFSGEYLKHCNHQFWLPDEDSEDKLYRGDDRHGSALNDVPITTDGVLAIEVLDAECAGKTPFAALSAIRFGHWPILAMACRHYRLPLPPNLWLDLLHDCRKRLPATAATTVRSPKAGDRLRNRARRRNKSAAQH